MRAVLGSTSWSASGATVQTKSTSHAHVEVFCKCLNAFGNLSLVHINTHKHSLFVASLALIFSEVSFFYNSKKREGHTPRDTRKTAAKPPTAYVAKTSKEECAVTWQNRIHEPMRVGSYSQGAVFGVCVRMYVCEVSRFQNSAIISKVSQLPSAVSKHRSKGRWLWER